MSWEIVAPVAAALAASASAWVAWKVGGRNSRLVIADINSELTTSEVARARELYSQFEWAYLQGGISGYKNAVSSYDGNAEQELFNAYYTLVGALERSVQRIQTIRPGFFARCVGRVGTRINVWLHPLTSPGLARQFPFVEEEIKEYLGWSLAQIIAWLHWGRTTLRQFGHDDDEKRVFVSSDESIAKCQRRLDDWMYVDTNADILRDRLDVWQPNTHSSVAPVTSCTICRHVIVWRTCGHEF